MSRDCSSVLFTNPKSLQSETNEKELGNVSNQAHFPPPRTPLNTITDPSQYQKENQDHELDSRVKFEASQTTRSSDRRIESSELILSKGIACAGQNYGTPRVPVRGKAKSEPNSTQSTPARRLSIVGSSGASLRVPQPIGSRGEGCTKVPRGASVVDAESVDVVPHFELMEDASFWRDHNVQVLIRIRPLSNTEMSLQGYSRCLKQENVQTLVWVGHPETRFTFDHIACESVSQEKLFKVAGLPMVENCMSGYNSCMFAYGQTGSGKTYTMMGEIAQKEGELSEDCGITPRIFEYLFRRIKEDEGNRKHDGLKYSCKCSFLEIYKEQITDLLKPSSTNLQLREDLKKGVYVENLSEYNVGTVDDILKILLQGATNRKMAATQMNGESSRSHSVFTCTIESYWEKDSMTHRRFGRLNLVDLAGSERQKSSGAEGDRLREAANINKSLSTLGLVIMSLVDLAHGKQRHVPYRDSRLTFLLQDSLGGNSKTAIIANVSPSIGSANETLSTLKFAQRAKLIQNNAKVNEDAPGDVPALQQQIQQLKGQLSLLLKHQNISQSLLPHVLNFRCSRLDFSPDKYDLIQEHRVSSDNNHQLQKMKCLEATLVGALRRERLAETEARRLVAEIQKMNLLVQQREEDSQHRKMVLRFREEKIKRLEFLVDGLLSADKYILDENNCLREEMELLRAKIDRNPDLTRLALENIRLLQQLKLFQSYYEQGEREMLLAEISELRDQLLTTFEGTFHHHQITLSTRSQNDDTAKEPENCTEMNLKLIREGDGLRGDLEQYVGCDCITVDSVNSESENGKIALDSQKEGKVSGGKKGQIKCNYLVSQSMSHQNECTDPKCSVETLKMEHVQLIEELRLVREENERFREILNIEKTGESQFQLDLEKTFAAGNIYEGPRESLTIKSGKNITTTVLQANLEKMSEEIDENRLLNDTYIDVETSPISQEHQINMICEKVEMETAKTILNLQHGFAVLEREFQEKLISMTEENVKMRNIIAAKEEEIKALNSGWERAIAELTNFLTDGSKSLREASGQIACISGLFSHADVLVCEKIDRAARCYVANEEMIINLQGILEEAQNMIFQMEQRLSSLKGATIAFTEAQLDNDVSNIELTELLNDKIKMIDHLKKELQYKEHQISKEKKIANVSLLFAKGLCNNSTLHENNFKGNLSSSLLSAVDNCDISDVIVCEKTFEPEDSEIQAKLASLSLLEVENAVVSSCADAEMFILSIQDDVQKVVCLYRELVNDILKDFSEMRMSCLKFRMNDRSLKVCNVENTLSQPSKCKKLEIHHQILHLTEEKLAETNYRLNAVKNCIDKMIGSYGHQTTYDNLLDIQSASSVASSSSISESTIPPEYMLDELPSFYSSNFTEKVSNQPCDEVFEQSSFLSNENAEARVCERLVDNSSKNETTFFYVRKEFEMIYDAFVNLNIQLAALFGGQEVGGSIQQNALHSCGTLASKDLIKQIDRACQHSQLEIYKAKGCRYDRKECFEDEKCQLASSFFTKFEEVHTTMREADYLLNALMEANENGKTLTGIWKQAGEELMAEKIEMTGEVKHLKSLICLKDQENRMILYHIKHILKDLTQSLSSLEESFRPLQQDVEEICKILCVDATIVMQDMLQFIFKSRSSLEEIFTKMLENEFSSFVRQHHMREAFNNKFKNISGGGGTNFHLSGLQKFYSTKHSLEISSLHGETRCSVREREQQGNQIIEVGEEKAGEMCLAYDHLIDKNLELENELERKEILLKGLLFDFSLLQESASTRKDIKDETEKLVAVLGQVRDELQFKTCHLEETLVQCRKLEEQFADAENALYASKFELEKEKEIRDRLLKQNAELRISIEDLCLKKSQVEDKLEEQRELVGSLEKEILSLTWPVEKQMFSSKNDAEHDFKRVSDDRDKLREQISYLQERLEMTCALADENEARAIEARHDSEMSKVYAEQKEEEVKLLEHSVEELEGTINILEKKVYEMEDEVERHRLMRDSLEVEHKELRHKLSTFKSFKVDMDHGNSNDEQEADNPFSRLLDLHKAHNLIKELEEERAGQAKEIKQLKEYISEIVLHAEAQASQYQQKFKALEEMVHGVKREASFHTSTASVTNIMDKNPTRTRGSSSPFRCIASLLQQMESEKDQELTIARLRIEELEALASSRQKEVCMLNARLAAAENMAHDIIRDLLGVKLDITNYVNLTDHGQLQKLVEMAQEQKQEAVAMEQEIVNLRVQVRDFFEEKNRCASEASKREADIMAIQFTVKQLQERNRLLTAQNAQNEVLKMDKINLKKRLSELGRDVRKTGRQTTTTNTPQQINRLDDAELKKRVAQSERHTFCDSELDQYQNSGNGH